MLRGLEYRIDIPTRRARRSRGRNRLFRVAVNRSDGGSVIHPPYTRAQLQGRPTSGLLRWFRGLKRRLNDSHLSAGPRNSCQRELTVVPWPVKDTIDWLGFMYRWAVNDNSATDTRIMITIGDRCTHLDHRVLIRRKPLRDSNMKHCPFSRLTFFPHCMQSETMEFGSGVCFRDKRFFKGRYVNQKRVDL